MKRERRVRRDPRCIQEAEGAFRSCCSSGLLGRYLVACSPCGVVRLPFYQPCYQTERSPLNTSDRLTKRDTLQLMSVRRYRTQEVAGSSPASSIRVFAASGVLRRSGKSSAATRSTFRTTTTMEKSTSAGTLRTSAWGRSNFAALPAHKRFPGEPDAHPAAPRGTCDPHAGRSTCVSDRTNDLLPYERLLRPDRLHPGRRADAG